MLIETLGALAEFFRGHIWKEDLLLLPMAEKVLSEEDKNLLADWLRFIESKSGAEAQKAVEGFNVALHHCTDAIAQPRKAPGCVSLQNYSGPCGCVHHDSGSCADVNEIVLR